MKILTKLHQIIDAIENGESLTIEEIAPFKRSIYTYMVEFNMYEPIVMVLSATNNTALIKIVNTDTFNEALAMETDDEDEQKMISANSRFLSEML